MQRVEWKQEQQKHGYDKRTCKRSFQEGQDVYLTNFSHYGAPWLAGHIIKFTGPVSVLLEVEGGFQVRRDLDQVRQDLTAQKESRWVLPESTVASQTPDRAPLASLEPPLPRTG